MGRAVGKHELRQYYLTSDTEFERFYGYQADKRRKLYNGMIRCDLYMYFKPQESRRAIESGRKQERSPEKMAHTRKKVERGGKSGEMLERTGESAKHIANKVKPIVTNFSKNFVSFFEKALAFPEQLMYHNNRG